MAMNPTARSTRKRLWRRWVVAAGIIVGVFVFGYSTGPTVVGAVQARRDLAAGQPRYLLCGELAPHEAEVAALLQQRHGIRLDRVAGCAVTETLVQRCDAYNRRVSERFGFAGGRDVFLSIVDELMQADRTANNTR
jgi:hypothetical protein